MKNFYHEDYEGHEGFRIWDFELRNGKKNLI